MLSGCAIAKGVVEKTAEKIRLQGALDSLVSLYAGERDDYASLYAAENLVGLFFADTSLSSATGVWYNKVENGENATLRDTSGRNYWRRKDNGIGYSMTFSQWGAGNQYREVGLSLPDSYAEFESFTVEAFAKVEGTTTATGERYVASGEAYKNWCSAFRLGLLTSLFFGNAKTATSGLGLRWGLSMTGWTGGIYNGTNGAYNIFSADDHSWIQMGPMMTPTAGVMQLTKNVKTETVDGASVTNITYGLAYNNKSGKSYTIDEAKHEGYLHYFDGDNMNFNSGAAKAYGEYADPFSLFNGVPATIYAVRVYDGLLTADEKAQNRLVDLMYYHDVAVPAGLTHDSEAMKTIAACANGITISEDAVAKAANKATIEAAIAAASSKVNIVAGADAQETIYAVGSTYTLPTMIDGQAVVAWTASNATGSYLPGASIALTNDMTVTAVVIDAPKTNSKVSIKPMSSSDGLAIRFTADFVRADMEAILDLYENVTVGMLIAPVRYVQAAGGIFTREALRAYVVENGVAADRAFVEVVATGFYVIGEETLTLAASLANFSNTTKAKNPDFTAVAFVDIDADNDGVVDYTVYGSYNALAKHNVKTVMQKALGGALTDTQKNWINSLLKEFGA